VDLQPPPAVGKRLAWEALPGNVRRALEAHLGAPVVEAASQPGGFSPGLASRLRLADGRRVFVKAVGPEPNPDSPEFHRAEARIAAALPPAAPSPRLLWAHDEAGWVALAFEDVDGRPPTLPWRLDELRRVLAAVADLAAALTPAPVDAPPVAKLLGGELRGWKLLLAAAERGEDDLRDVDPWVVRHLDRLAAAEARFDQAAAGGSLLHGDLRADNLLLTPDRVVVVDWPWGCVGAA
jgi:Ser/Thr protein kinase RdoA (MazF antagonist)